MYKFLFFLSVVLVLTSCSSAKPSVITTKKVALQKKQYSPYSPKNATTASTNVPKKVPSLKVSVNATETKSAPSDKAPTPGIFDHNEEDILETEETATYFSEQLVNNALANMGAPYRSGGTNSEGFDCSGLMYATFENFAILLPRSSNEMAKIGRVLERHEIRRGDLIFFKTNGSRIINHVGLVTEISSDEIKFVHSSTQQGVVISSTKEPYYQRTFVQVNRVIE